MLCWVEYKTPNKISAISQDELVEIPKFEKFLMVVENVVEQSHQNDVHQLRICLPFQVEHSLQPHEDRPDGLGTDVVGDLVPPRRVLEQDAHRGDGSDNQ